MNIAEMLAKARSGAMDRKPADLPLPPPPPKPKRTIVLNEPITQSFRPQLIAEVLGQEHVTGWLSRFAKNPHHVALLFSGESGVGKTSAALALARELGSEDVMTGLQVIASGEQSADAVRECVSNLWLRPFGNDWHVCVVNECDRMSKQAETIWLDALESLPPHAVVVFTTNHADTLSDRFKDRCQCFEFKSREKDIRGAAIAYANEIAEKLDIHVDAQAIVAGCAREGKLSLRRVANAIAAIL